MSVLFKCDNPNCTKGDGGTIKEEEANCSGIPAPARLQPPSEWIEVGEPVSEGIDLKYFCCNDCFTEYKGS